MNNLPSPKLLKKQAIRNATTTNHGRFSFFGLRKDIPFAYPEKKQDQQNSWPCKFLVAGTGFEPMTSGL